jgi:hypothetical protein
MSAAAVLLIGLTTVTVLRLAGATTQSRDRTRGGDFDLTVHTASDFEKPQIPDDQNAATWLQAGAGAISRTSEEKDAVAEATLLPYDEWPDELRKEVRNALDDHRGGLETMHTAAGLEESSYGIRYSDGFEAEIPELLLLIDANRLLMLEARVALADGEEQRTLTALATMSRLAESLQAEPTTITALVGIACERMMLQVAGEAVASAQPWITSPGFLDELESVIPSTSGGLFIGHLFDGWTAVMELELHRWADGTSIIDPAGLEQLAELGVEEIAYNRAQLLALLNMPYGDEPSRFDEPRQLSLFVMGGSPASDIEGFLKAITRFQAAEAQRQLVRAGISLRRIAIAEGAYPTTPPDIPELTEPDPFTGRRLIYMPGPDGSLALALDDAIGLLERIVMPSSARSLAPITLPAP